MMRLGLGVGLPVAVPALDQGVARGLAGGRRMHMAVGLVGRSAPASVRPVASWRVASRLPVFPFGRANLADPRAAMAVGE